MGSKRNQRQLLKLGPLNPNIAICHKQVQLFSNWREARESTLIKTIAELGEFSSNRSIKAILLAGCIRDIKN